jgi:prephenate dehydrogenase
MFNKVAVIGTGLIGGSLALAIKRQKLAKEVVGVARHQASLELALRRKGFPNYLGSHPLAGSEKRGVLHAQAGIFKGTLCILTPTVKTRRAAMKKIQALWQRTGAKVICLSPEEHDRVLSFTSHLPHAVAFSLIDSIPDESLKFSASGLKDTTRIAASDALLWQGIFLTNRKNMLKAITAFEKKLSRIKSAISRNDKKKLTAILALAQKKRNSLG